MLKNSIILISEPVPFWNYFNSVGKFFLLTAFDEPLHFLRQLKKMTSDFVIHQFQLC